jgi:hypothetical protein
MFTVAYLSVDPCVSMLAVLITYPKEHGELVPEAFRCIRETLRRLNVLRPTNKMAGQGADVIQTLLLRAEQKHTHAQTSSAMVYGRKSETPTSTTGRSSDVFMTPSSSHREAPQQPNALLVNRDPQASSYSDMQFANMPDWSAVPLFDFPPTTTSATADALGTLDYSFNETPFRPTADLTYHDLAPAQSYQDIRGPGADSDVIMGSSNPQPNPEQFRGDFDDSSFWGYINRTSG